VKQQFNRVNLGHLDPLILDLIPLVFRKKFLMIEQYTKLRNRINLKPRYLRIFEFKHGIDDEPHPLKESGKMFGISPERVRQIIVRVHQSFCC